MTSTLSNTVKLPSTSMDSKNIFFLASKQNCLIKENDISIQKKDLLARFVLVLNETKRKTMKAGKSPNTNY